MLRTTSYCSLKSTKSQEARAQLDSLLRRAGVRAESVKRIAAVALATAGVGGEITERQLAELTGYALSTVRLACRRLCGLKVLAAVPKPLGRGYLKAYRVIWGMSERSFSSNRRNLKKSLNIEYKELKTKNKTHSKDAGASGCVKNDQRRWHVRGGTRSHVPLVTSSLSDYQGSQAAQVTLIMGARFYRYVMKAIRLGLEEWALSESVRDALEGFFGLRIDGASLSYARELRDRIWALRAEIERLAASGASPRRVCSFVAGKLAGIPERSRREVLRRTDQLLTDVEQLERRITGLKAWLAEREREYREGRVCPWCGYQHSEIEYRSGYKNDGSGRLNCFGFARLRLEELQEQFKLRARTERCRICGGSLTGGHVDGVCWGCYDRAKAQGRISMGPVMVGDLIVTALKNLDLKSAQLASESAGVDQSIPLSETAVCKGCQSAPATAYGYCDSCRRLLVRRLRGDYHA